MDNSRARKLAGVVAVLTEDTLVKNASWESHYGPVMETKPSLLSTGCAMQETSLPQWRLPGLR